MSAQTDLSDRELIDSACAALGLSVDALGEKMRFKSLKRYRAGEFTLTPAKRQHIQDLVLREQARGRAPSIEVTPSLRHAPSNMSPPQQVPPLRLTTCREEMPAYDAGVLPDFGQAVKWLSEIQERNPEAYRSAVAMIKGLYKDLCE